MGVFYVSDHPDHPDYVAPVETPEDDQAKPEVTAKVIGTADVMTATPSPVKPTVKR